ncbi:MAG: helix-turn-helix transcriptional regulator [Lachnospiraceae bacterium]|nr:helix-turn-helix transcriptional regulator [Lachnospiraceae bacterium]
MVGERIQQRRLSLGLSQDQLAERIDRATKYYSDIERGTCGMSVETMLAISQHLKLNLDYMMFGLGNITNEPEEPVTAGIRRTTADCLLEHCTEREYDYALRMLEIFIESMKHREE